MNMPTFTAQASLYKTNRHYRTGRQTIKLPTQMLRAISPAMIREGIDCSNCVGGECAELRCFETWTHGGGGPEGPYHGPGEPPLFPNGGGGTQPPRPKGPCGYRRECKRVPYTVCDANGCRTEYGQVCNSYPLPCP
jgi:hypothetical protein